MDTRRRILPERSGRKPETGWNPICSISAERILQERYEYVG